MAEKKRYEVLKNLVYHGGGANAVRWVRESRGLTQGELATRSGVSQNSVSRIETGKRKPHKGTLKKLAAALGLEDWTTLDVDLPAALTLEEIDNWSPEQRRRLFELYRETGFLGHITEQWAERYRENRELYKDDAGKDEYIASKLESAYMLGYAKGYHEGRKREGSDDET